MYSIEPVIKLACSTLGEGPHWDATTQSLLYVDFYKADVHQWNSLTKKIKTVHFDYPSVSLVVPCTKGGYVISTTHSLSHLDWDSEKLTQLVEIEKGQPTQTNDGKCDARGRLWAGNQRTAVDFNKAMEEQLGVPDGMTIDTEGKLWVACYNAGKVVRVDPELGKVLREVKMPTKKITSVVWGGPNLDELYVTSARIGFSDCERQTTESLSGSVFKIRCLGFKGRPANNYQG